MLNTVNTKYKYLISVVRNVKKRSFIFIAAAAAAVCLCYDFRPWIMIYFIFCSINIPWLISLLVIGIEHNRHNINIIMILYDVRLGYNVII